MPATTMSRVPEHTDTKANRRIYLTTECDVARYASAPQDAIEKRIRRLEREWDIERSLETNAAVFSLAGLVLGVFVNRKWLVLPAVVAGFLLQHALQGWSPPVPVMRRLGIRTAAEIDRERYALKVLKGDFAEVCGPGPVDPVKIVRAAGR